MQARSDWKALLAPDKRDATAAALVALADQLGLPYASLRASLYDPAALALLGLGVAGLSLARRRR